MSKLLTKAEWSALFPKLKYVLSDCDGVLWNGDRAIEGAREFLATLRKDGKRVCFVTNNSTKTREEIVTKCQKLGFEAELGDVYGTAYATAAYLKVLGVSSVYLIGSPAVHHEITSLGIKCIGLGPDELDGNWTSWLSIKLEEGIQAVVAGFDAHFSLSKVCRAASYLLKPDCHFIVTNRDQSLPSERKGTDGCPSLLQYIRSIDLSTAFILLIGVDVPFRNGFLPSVGSNRLFQISSCPGPAALYRASKQRLDVHLPWWGSPTRR